VGVIDRVHVVMLGSRVGWIVGIDGELVDGELDIDVHGGVGVATSFHGRFLDHDVKVGGVDFVVVDDFIFVECVGVSDELALSNQMCGCC
jgi:hypothetical protein